MTPTHEEIAGGRRDDGTGLLGSAMNASTGVDSGRIVASERPVIPSIEQNESLQTPQSVVESSGGPTAALGPGSSGKSRVYSHGHSEITRKSINRS